MSANQKVSTVLVLVAVIIAIAAVAFTLKPAPAGEVVVVETEEETVDEAQEARDALLALYIELGYPQVGESVEFDVAVMDAYEKGYLYTQPSGTFEVGDGAILMVGMDGTSSACLSGLPCFVIQEDPDGDVLWHIADHISGSPNSLGVPLSSVSVAYADEDTVVFFENGWVGSDWVTSAFSVSTEDADRNDLLEYVLAPESITLSRPDGTELVIDMTECQQGAENVRPCDVVVFYTGEDEVYRLEDTYKSIVELDYTILPDYPNEIWFAFDDVDYIYNFQNSGLLIENLATE